ncbi:ribonuclease H protein [Trifolium medium]|uniref:Ribonuclease H protein n=1 Tax=Trifolium medium TaxID=97028 RepID=A0A392M0K6_9FABA|nr:ribonuclease H protein [Trifolium medium]
MNSDTHWAIFLRSRIVRSNSFIGYHIYSSIWSGLKAHSSHLFDNSRWLLGNGNKINFWTHDWSGITIVDLLHIPLDLHQHLSATVSDFIRQQQWNIPLELQMDYPNLMHHLSNVCIPVDQKEDRLIWKHSTSGELTLKDAFQLFSPNGQSQHWAKLIWNAVIPPSKSIWKHFNCFAAQLWAWLANIIQINIVTTSVISVFNICSRGWNQHCGFVISAAVISIFNAIWTCRNNLRFKGIIPNLNNVIGKAFKVDVHYSIAPRIIEIIWQPHVCNWLKCNTDGTSLGNPGQAACAGVFRNSHGEYMGSFAMNLGIANALYAEIMGVILAIEFAIEKHWNFLWIESDSKLATLAFKSPLIVPWHIKNRWLNCLSKVGSLQFIISHIFREGNYCTNKLANLGLSLSELTWWPTAPNCIWEDLAKNRQGLPYYRFC